MLVVIVGGGLAAMNYLAPLQLGPVLFDLALVAILAGGISLLIPLRFLDIRRRGAGLWVLGTGVIVVVLVLSWPPSVHTVVRRCALDDFLPTYSSREFHAQLVHTAPARVYRAIRESTVEDIKVLVPLGNCGRDGSKR
jgi:hypothetical protein